MSKATLKAAPRGTEKRSELKQLRKAGRVPGVLYGFGEDARRIEIQQTELKPVLKRAHGATLLIDLEIEGDATPVTTVFREVQRDPLTREILHCDLLKVDMTRKYNVTVPIVILGEAVGVKIHGGVMDVQTREIEIRCLPGEIPEHYEIDVTAMEIGDSVHVADIPHGKEEFATHGDVLVVAVAAPRKMTLEEEAAEAEAAEAEAAEGAKDDESEEKAEAESS
ncbi:MAG: 50S ribosomal protein L25 [Candidatus Eisenbacteria bacterium]